jgi:hypothetical protein
MNTAPNNNGGRRAWPTAVAVLGACLIFVALVWAMKRYTQPAPLGQDRAAVRAKNLAELRAADAEALNNAGWVDPVKGIVRLPIAEAMKLAERLWQNPSQARSNLVARVEKATAVGPNPFE